MPTRPFAKIDRRFRGSDHRGTPQPIVLVCTTFQNMPFMQATLGSELNFRHNLHTTSEPLLRYICVAVAAGITERVYGLSAGC